MERCCCVPLCSSRAAPGFIAYHPLPSEPCVRQAWIEFVRSCPRGGVREWTPPQSGEAFVCHRHFALGSFDFRQEDGRPTVLRACLKADAVPTVYLGEEGRFAAAADKADAQGSSAQAQASSTVQSSQENICPSTSTTCPSKKHHVMSMAEQHFAAKVACTEAGMQSKVKAAAKSISSTVSAAPSSMEEDSVANSSRTLNALEVTLCPNPEPTTKEGSHGRTRTRNKRQACSAARQHVMAKVARLQAGVQNKVEGAAESTSCSVGAGSVSMEGSVGNASKIAQAAETLDASDIALNAETEEPAEEKALEWCPAGPSSRNRVSWPDAVTSSLIRIWEDYFPKLNANTENTSLYEEMAAKLNAGLSPGEALYSANQVLVKINRLTKRYWKEKRTGFTKGSIGREWSIRLHSFLGSLPASDDDQLMDQNVEVEVVAEETEEVETPPLLDQGADKTECLSSRESESDMADFLSSTSDSEESSDVTSSESNGRNKLCVGNAAAKRSIRRGVSNSFLWQLVAIQKESARRAAEDDQKHLEMRNKVLKLQEESTRMNTKMMEMLTNYFTSRSNKE